MQYLRAHALILVALPIFVRGFRSGLGSIAMLKLNGSDQQEVVSSIGEKDLVIISRFEALKFVQIHKIQCLS